jgi:hypothetical protein
MVPEFMLLFTMFYFASRQATSRYLESPVDVEEFTERNLPARNNTLNSDCSLYPN